MNKRLQFYRPLHGCQIAFFFVVFFFFSFLVRGQCPTWYRDSDGDGFGNSAVTQVSCPSLAGYVLNRLDCNDAFINIAIRKSIGGGGFSTGATITTKIDIGSDGLPVVLYQNFTSSGAITSVGVKKFNGTSWLTLGADPISTFYDMNYTNLTLDQNGVPYISFIDYESSGSPNNKVTVLKYNSVLNTWDLVGPRRFSVELFNDTRIDIKFDNNGVLYTAFLDDASNMVVMKFDNLSSNWQLVGASGFASSVSEPSLAFDGANIPYVSFANGIDNKATVMNFDGAAWVDVGIAGFSDGDVESPKIDINKANEPYVAYYDYGVNEVVVQKFDGAAWVKVGNTPVEASTGISVSLAIDLLDVPIVAYQSGSGLIKLKKLNASNNWVNITSTVNNGLRLSMVIGPDNIPYVSFGNLTDGDKATAQSVAPQIVIPTTPTVSATPGTICAGDNTTLNLTAGTLNDGTRWTWYAGGCGSGGAIGTGTSLSVAPTATTTYYVRGEGNCTTSVGLCSTVTVTVDQKPLIATDRSIQYLDGGSASFTSDTGHPTYSYQWQLNSGSGVFTPIANGGIYSGATSVGLTINPLNTALNGYIYRNRITNGACTIYDGELTIYVTGMPASTTTCLNGNTSFSVLTSNGHMTYQWQEDAGSGFVNVSNSSVYSGATSRELVITGATLAMNNFKYRVNITDASSNTVTTNGLATLTINIPSTITGQPAGTQNLCVGNAMNLSVTATGTGLSYQWKKNGTDIGGATSSTYSIASVAVADAATYTVAVTSSGVCTPSSVLSGNAVVNVNTPSTITTQPTATQNLCVGNAMNLSVTATGTGLSYQWKKNGTDIVGATLSTYTIASVSVTDAANYTVAITSSGVCTPSSVLSGNAVVNVNTPSTITAQPTGTQNLCVGNAMNLSVTATGTGLSYQWKKNGTNIGGATSSTYSIASVSITDAATYTVTITSSGVCTPSSVISGSAVVRINAAPAITTQPTDATVCASGNASFNIAATGTNLTYQWQENRGAGFVNISNTGVYSGVTSSTLQLRGVSVSMDNYKFRVVISNTGCTAAISNGSATLKINVIQSISTQPTNVIVCEGGNANFVALSSNGNLTYQWQVDDGGGFANINDGEFYTGATSNSLVISSAEQVMDGYKFRVSVRGNCVDEFSQAATLSIHALPDISAGPDKKVELGGSVTLEGRATGDSPLQYQWTPINDQAQASILQPTVSPVSDIEYTLLVTSVHGCFVTDVVQVKVMKEMVIPNAFSPNSDAINDTWKIENLDPLVAVSVQVFNRYGQPVFTSNSNSFSWDGTYQGKLLPWGTYYYIIELENSGKPVSGWVVILN